MTTPTSGPGGRDGGAFVFDAARAVAALAVLAAHARTLVMLDRGQQPALSLPAELFLALTALGHQAVVVFFVVSGALVTRSMLATVARGAWSPSRFVAARLVRLWTVLLPCLVLGGTLDRIGLAVIGALPDGGYGEPGTAASAVAAHLGVSTLAGNLAFLQALKVPTFGSNGPLWTLAMEAWCYALACALLCLWRARDAARAELCLAAIAAAAIFVLTPPFWLICPLWFVGAALGWALHKTEKASPPASFRRASRRWTADDVVHRIAEAGHRRPIRWLAGLALAAALLAARAADRHQLLADYALACVTAVVLLALSLWTPRPDPIVHALRGTARFSYTLYLSHFPLLALLTALVLCQHRMPLGPESLALWAAASALALAYAGLLWWLFERHTGTVRAIVLASFGRGRRSGFAGQEAAP